MQTEIVVRIETKDYDCVVDMAMALMVTFAGFVKDYAFQMYYQMPLPYKGMTVTYGCFVEAPKKDAVPNEAKQSEEAFLNL